MWIQREVEVSAAHNHALLVRAGVASRLTDITVHWCIFNTRRHLCFYWLLPRLARKYRAWSCYTCVTPHPIQMITIAPTVWWPDHRFVPPWWGTGEKPSNGDSLPWGGAFNDRLIVWLLNHASSFQSNRAFRAQNRVTALLLCEHAQCAPALPPHCPITRKKLEVVCLLSTSGHFPGLH